MTECNFCNKYNMSLEDFKRAVRDGKISTTVMRHDEIYTKFKQELASTGETSKAIVNISVNENLAIRTVYDIVAEFR